LEKETQTKINVLSISSNRLSEPKGFRQRTVKSMYIHTQGLMIDIEQIPLSEPQRDSQTLRAF